MNQLHLNQTINLINTFNQAYKVGDKVEVMTTVHNDKTFIDEIKHEATLMGNHSGMVWLKDKGSYEISFVIRKLEDGSES